MQKKHPTSYVTEWLRDCMWKSSDLLLVVKRKKQEQNNKS